MPNVFLHPRFMECADRRRAMEMVRLDRERGHALDQLCRAATRARGLQSRFGVDRLLAPLIAELEVTCRTLEELDVEKPPTKLEMDSLVRRTQGIAESFEAVARLLAALAPKPEAAEG